MFNLSDQQIQNILNALSSFGKNHKLVGIMASKGLVDFVDVAGRHKLMDFIPIERGIRLTIKNKQYDVLYQND